MKLIRADIKNFRLLKDLQLDFSTQADKPLTIIRAANESGKTTCQYALMWGIWGEEGLPDKYQNFNIISFSELDTNQAVPEVTIEFEAEAKEDQPHKRYRLIRKYIAASNPPIDDLTIFEIQTTGAVPLYDAEKTQLIQNILPESLKDVYFTDGDRALSFIEASSSPGVKKRRVENAIKSLLSLDILTDTIRHINTVSTKFESEVDNRDYAQEFELINNHIISYNEDIAEQTERLQGLESKKTNLEQGKKTVNAKIEEIIRQGDKNKLIGERKRIQRELESLIRTEAESLKAMRNNVQNENVSLGLLKDDFNKAKSYLADLKDKKQLPKANVPILEELLDKPKCFCGSSLDELTDEGRTHRHHIQVAIVDSEEADRKTELATSLHFAIYRSDTDKAIEQWKNKYNSSSQQYYNLSKLINDKQFELDKKEEEIAQVQDDGLDIFRTQLREYENKLMETVSDISEANTIINTNQERLESSEREKQKIQKKLNKNDKSTNKIELSKTLKRGFDNILNKLKGQEVEKVSQEMNRIFLDMVGSSADSNDFSSITKAELSSNYEILVYGMNGQKINPDQDLNGASRRAITLAFILALTKISQVEAPNVIDTPLGMMSGYVKQSVLRQMVKEGSQIILFLTHDEINGVEPLIDRYAGAVYTLTNPAHYPKILKNKPLTENGSILRCDCNHHESCSVCERNNYLEEA